MGDVYGREITRVSGLEAGVSYDADSYPEMGPPVGVGLLGEKVFLFLGESCVRRLGLLVEVSRV